MKKKVLTTVLCMVMAISSISTGCSGKTEKQIEEAMENADFDKAKELTSNDSNYHDLYTALDIYLRVSNDVQMESVHVVLDNDEESEFKEELNQLDEIPKVYKKYPELKSRVNIYKDELEKAVDLEEEFRKGFKKLDKLYKEHLEYIINDIFKNKLTIYIMKGYDPSKMEDFESPYEKVQEENQDGDYDEVFTPESGESSDSSIDDIQISPDDVRIE